MSQVLGRREGFPQPTWDRCARWPSFSLHTGSPIENARSSGAGVELTIAGNPVQVDFVISGTGMDIDPAHRPELAAIAPHIAAWADRYTPPAEFRDDRLGRYPYLAPDYSLTERVPGTAPELVDIHVFSIASTMSFGPSGSSINAMTSAVPKLVRLLLGSGVVGSSHNQAGDQGAEQGFAASVRIVHELEEAEVKR